MKHPGNPRRILECQLHMLISEKKMVRKLGALRRVQQGRSGGPGFCLRRLAATGSYIFLTVFRRKFEPALATSGTRPGVIYRISFHFPVQCLLFCVSVSTYTLGGGICRGVKPVLCGMSFLINKPDAFAMLPD